VTDVGLRIIKSGLKPDDRVIVSGLQRAIPGNVVKPVETTANAAPLPATPTPAAPVPAVSAPRKDKS
jgi:membrane fusion protein (multidrug efflux system)